MAVGLSERSLDSWIDTLPLRCNQWLADWELSPSLVHSEAIRFELCCEANCGFQGNKEFKSFRRIVNLNFNEAQSSVATLCDVMVSSFDQLKNYCKGTLNARISLILGNCDAKGLFQSRIVISNFNNKSRQ